MDFMELLERTRSCRRFEQTVLPVHFLDHMIEAARICPSARNSQPLKYILIESEESCSKVFPLIGWAGSLKDWDGPIESERPVAYIAIVLDKTISSSPGIDVGITAQSIQLAAMEQGIGSCMIGAFNKTKMTAVLDLSEQEDIQLLIALGYPRESRKIVSMENTESTSYYRDKNQVHYVPKRSKESLILKRM